MYWKVNEFKVPNLIISIIGKEETCLKFWTALEPNYGIDLEGQGKGQSQRGLGSKFYHFYSSKDKTFLKFWTTLEQNCGLDVEGKGQGQGGQGP